MCKLYLGDFAHNLLFMVLFHLMAVSRESRYARVVVNYYPP
jgi:hypothetical protein